MRSRNPFPESIFLALGVTGLLAGAVATPPAAGAPADARVATTAAISDPALAAIVDRFVAAAGARDFYARLQAGQRVDAIPAGSLDEAREDAALARGLLDDLAKVPFARLNPHDRLSAEILQWALGHRLAAERNWWYEFPVTTYTTFDLTLAFQALAANPLQSGADRDGYLALLDSIATRLDTARDRLGQQAKRNIRFPAPAAGPAAEYFGALQARFAQLPADTERRTAALLPGERAAFVEKVRARVDGRVQPARAALVTELEAAARTGPQTVGLAQYPGGKEVYRDLARFHTSLDVTPEDVRDYGEARIRRINAEIDALARELGIEGGRAGIRDWLRKDERFRAQTPDDVAARYMRAMARIVPKMPEYFPVEPKAPFGVRRLDPAAEGSMTFGFYQAPTAREPTGEYRFNGSRLEDRSLVFAAPIIYHELLPGHHFQVALQLENESLPPFRRKFGMLGFNAYTEGWAEYAAELAGEMGLYDDPHDRLGRLMLDAFLSARLVVDSGLNYFGWSLEDARRYMAENTYQSTTEIATETLRYATAIPGQALGYKMGHRVFDDLRAAVAKRQGADFDLRAFHGAVLDPGAMPLTVLQQHVARVYGLAGEGPAAAAAGTGSSGR